MFVLNNAEELNKLFIRNKDMNMLLNEKDRSELLNMINELPEDHCLNSIQTFLALQVKYSFLIIAKCLILFFQENDYSIEIIWQLHTKQIIDFSEFVTWSVEYLLIIFILLKLYCFVLATNGI